MHDIRPEAGPTVHDLVASRVAAHPDRVALVSANGELTYGELLDRADRLAAHLADLGVGLDVPVGVFLERSTTFVVTVLAVLRAGGNYVPLDPHYPATRLELMLRATAAPVVVTTVGLAERLPTGAATVVQLDERTDVPIIAAATGPGTSSPAGWSAPRVHPDNLAYTMFTSGSTGVPKGVEVCHAGIVRLVDNPEHVRLDHTEVVLHLSSVSFDAATFEIWGALVNGARLVVGPAGPVSVSEIGALLHTHRVTTAFLTTGLFHLVVDERLEDLSGLRQLVTGGDQLSSARAERVRAAFPGCRLVNAYGPTEVTSFTTCYDVPADVADGPGVPIGRAIAKTWVRLLDADLQPVPDGTAGHLYAGGEGLARGYLGDAALTARRFVPDPWLPGQRMYATGDLARMRADGTLEFLGRADQQVKRRGFRVELGEIEDALRRDADLRDAVVIPDGDSADNRVLIAYLLPRASEPVSDALVAVVRDRLRGQLPDYMVPDGWAVLDAFPLNANGKVDRQALVGTAALRLDAAQETSEPSALAAPQGETESALAEIWRELFELDQVGRHDDFFDLGGHSLLASRMVARVRAALGVDVPLVDVFDNPTVAEVAALIESA